MKQAYGPDRIAQSYADKAMSFRMEENKDKIIEREAQRFEAKIANDLQMAFRMFAGVKNA